MKSSIDKKRTMLRSILPSTKRKEVRKSKRKLHQVQRRRVRHNLGAYKGYEDQVENLYDELGEDLTDYITPLNGNYRGRRDWDAIVWERRNADKLNHFEHWAWKITRHMPVKDRYDYMRSILPDNLVGRHALSHLEFLRFSPLNPDEQLVPGRYYSSSVKEINSGPNPTRTYWQMQRQAYDEMGEMVIKLINEVHGSRTLRLKINEKIEKWNAETRLTREWIPAVGFRYIHVPCNYNFPYMSVHTQDARNRMVKLIVRNSNLRARLFAVVKYVDPVEEFHKTSKP